MRFDIFTLFPEVCQPYLQTSIMQKARQRGLVEINLYNIRDWTSDRHHVTDDEPYGGGGGMVMKPEPIFAAVEGVLGRPPACPVILMTPQGRLFNQQIAQELAELPRLALLSGRYEGVDERVRGALATDEISIGDYVLTGGELAALVIVDAVARLVPGVVGDESSVARDTFARGLLDFPQYTRPAEFRGMEVPPVLLSGHHQEIDRWRRREALVRTLERRPDLLDAAALDAADREILEELKQSR